VESCSIVEAAISGGSSKWNLQNLIRRAIEMSRQAGVITFDQLNELCPSSLTMPEDIERLMQALSDEGIDVVED